MNWYLALDVGGTEVKGCALSETGAPLCEPVCVPARAAESRAAILDNLRALFASLAARADGGVLAGAAFAFPGEFDYPAGICRIRGIGKYESLYGVNLRDAFGAMLRGPGTAAGLPLLFINDVEAFALGESGPAGRLLALAVGTGAGSSFLVDGRPAPDGTPGVPRNGWVYDTPFHGSIIDDWISRRGLMALSREALGEALDGLALAQRCAAGDAGARGVYGTFGGLLAEAMAPFVSAFRPQQFVLGGQITKSFALFGAPLEQLCARYGAALRITADTSRAAFRGLYRVLSEHTAKK